MIIFDEVGQLSSQEFSLLDLILRQIRQNDMPFGGVLIIGSFDHMQINSIDGLPFLLSSHLLTDYTIVKLEHSVRAAGDKKLMVSGIKMILTYTYIIQFMSFNSSCYETEVATNNQNKRNCIKK